MKFYYGVNPAEKREQLLKSDAIKPFLDEMIASADMAISAENPAFKMSEYLLFYQNGNRSVYEKGYFERRRRCGNLAFALWLTEDKKYLVPLTDYIGYICDEFTWCLPAHVDFTEELTQKAVEHVDLFQAETARLFAEIKMIVGEKLPEYMLDRMQYEVHRRIFTSFLREPEKAFNWEKTKNNWATVCAGGCTMAALYFATDSEKEYLVNRFTPCMDNYLLGIGDDGCCVEGMGYWNYGFEHFVMMAQALKVHSDGEIDYFKHPKVHELALFPQRIRMSKSKVAAFSDGSENFNFKIGHLSLLKKLYDDVQIPDLSNGSRRGNVDSVCEFLWFEEHESCEETAFKPHYFKNLEWYISRKEKFSFAAKGGTNFEPHNHNDLGSFMITVGDKIFISDLGCGEYVRETFRPESRYTFVQNSSRGHSVPIVNGAYQCTGPDFYAKNAKATENTFSLCLENAYEKGAVQEIKRDFEIGEDKVILTDTVTFSENTQSVTERFISKIKPEICDGFVDFGIGKIKYDAKKYVPSLGTETFVAHNAVDVVTVYQLDFTPVSKDETVFRFEFLI